MLDLPTIQARIVGIREITELKTSLNKLNNMIRIFGIIFMLSLIETIYFASQQNIFMTILLGFIFMSSMILSAIFEQKYKTKNNADIQA